MRGGEQLVAAAELLDQAGLVGMGAGVGVLGVVVVKRIAAPGPVDVDREVSEVLVVVNIGLTKRLVNRWTVASGVVGEGLAEDHPLDRESGSHQYEADY